MEASIPGTADKKVRKKSLRVVSGIKIQDVHATYITELTIETANIG